MKKPVKSRDQLIRELKELHERINLLESVEFNAVTENINSKNEGYCRALLEELPVLICRFLPDGEIMYVNKAYCSFFGKTSEELTGRNFLSMIPEEDRKTVMTSILELTEESPTQSLDHPVIAPDGKVLWQRWTNRALFNKQGKVFAYQGIGEDITCRKQAERTAALHLNYLENIAKIDRIIQRSTDIEQMISDVLDAILDIFGTDRAWLLYPCDPEAEFWSVPMERTRPEYPGAFALGENIPMLHEARVLFREALDRDDVITVDSLDPGAPKETNKMFSTLSQMYMAVHPLSGKPWVFGMHQCSHHRKWTEEEINQFREAGYRFADALSSMIFLRDLRESEERFRAIFDSARDCVFIKDRYLRYRQVNPAMEQLFGLPASELIGMSDEDLFGTEAGIHIRESDSRVLNGETSDEEHTKPVMGVERTFHAIKVPMHDASGEIVGICGISRDITNQKNAKKKRLELELQIQHAQKLESLGVLAGGIAHDFNNIIMAILGNANLVLMDLSTANPAYSNLKAIETAAKRATDLAKQMLAYSGKGKFLIEKISLNEAIDEMINILEISISKKAVIKYHLADNLPLIKADSTQIRQIVMNLVTNASDAINRTSGVISITTGVMDCDSDYLASTYIDESLVDGQYVYIEVTDTGCGMNKETMERLFDPFYTTKFTGRGLGLAAVLGIIRGHNGTIKVYSELGRGTSIKVLFPICDNTNEVADQAGNGIVEHWSGSGTILLVDDEVSILSIGKQMLERMGFDVITASDGRRAVELFRDNSDSIVLVILDLTMPHLDGEETFRELRRLRSDIRVMMCSGYNEQDVTQRFAGKSLAGFLQKPYIFNDLEAGVKKILGT